MSNPSDLPAAVSSDATHDAPVRVSVAIDKRNNPFATMGPEERMRMFIRVLCELVAYGEIDEHGKPLARPMPAHRRSRVSPGV